MKKIIVVPHNLPPALQRLDKFLVAEFKEESGTPGVSRSRVQQWIKEGLVLVNAKRVAKHFALRGGGKIKIEIDEKQAHAPTSVSAIPVIYEDADIIVLHKPAGLIVHPAAHTPPEPTVVDFLLQHYPPLRALGERTRTPDRPGIVQRLDRDVSGVMVVVKNEVSFNYLKSQFRSRRVNKNYRAIVHGVPAQSTGIIQFDIARSQTKKGKMAARPSSRRDSKSTGSTLSLPNNVRPAQTYYEVLQLIKYRYAYLAVRILTGRTHQIRAHLSAIDHPIVGDPLYTSAHYATKRRFPRLFLHSFELAFTHPTTRQPVTFFAPLPPEFEDFLKK